MILFYIPVDHRYFVFSAADLHSDLVAAVIQAEQNVFATKARELGIAAGRCYRCSKARYYQVDNNIFTFNKDIDICSAK